MAVVITAVRPPNQSAPVNSFGANVSFDSSVDASPIVVPIPDPFATVLANYGGTGVPALNKQLKFKLTEIVHDSTTTNLAVSYDGAGNLDIAFLTSGGGAETVYVEVAIPTTNDAP
jgi:hypothetical protein